MVFVTEGSNTEKRGKSKGLEKANFSCVERRLMTPPQFISGPGAGSVSTDAKGKALPIPARSVQMT